AQRRVVPVFVAAVAFNLAANLALVPRYGARASAALTVATEIVILAAFVLLGRRGGLTGLDRKLIDRLWRPTAAGVVAALVALVLRESPILATSAGILVFVLLGWCAQ